MTSTQELQYVFCIRQEVLSWHIMAYQLFRMTILAQLFSVYDAIEYSSVYDWLKLSAVLCNKLVFIHITNK